MNASPSLNDGFNGARDASLLERYAECLGIADGKITVQAVQATKALLHRAGFRRTRTHDSYEVPVMRDRFNRWQIAA
jgi:hypothetical protein